MRLLRFRLGAHRSACIYRIAVKLDSALVFVAGNIVVDVILVIYLFRHKTESSEETTPKQ